MMVGEQGGRDAVPAEAEAVYREIAAAEAAQVVRERARVAEFSELLRALDDALGAWKARALQAEAELAAATGRAVEPEASAETGAPGGIWAAFGIAPKSPEDLAREEVEKRVGRQRRLVAARTGAFCGSTGEALEPGETVRVLKGVPHKVDHSRPHIGGEVPATCAVCDRGVLIPYAGSWVRRRAFCSYRCRTEFGRGAARAKRDEARETRPCAHCGEHFTPARSDAAFCSGACRQAAHRKSRALRINECVHYNEAHSRNGDGAQSPLAV